MRKGGSVPIESKDTASDDHVPRDLERHASSKEHFLSSVRMIGGVVETFGFPQLLLCGLRRCSAISGGKVENTPGVLCLMAYSLVILHKFSSFF